MFDNLTVVMSFTYSLLILMGGIIGYCKAKSLASLISGCGFGLILFLSTFLLLKGVLFARMIIIGITGLIMVVFSKTLINSLMKEKNGLVRSVVILIFSFVQLYLLVVPQ